MNKLDRLLLNHDFEVFESINYVIENLNQNDEENFTIQKNDKHNFRFLSNISLGIGTVNNLFFSPINVNAKFISIEENKTKVTLYTKWRIDLIFIMVVSFLAMLHLAYNQLYNNTDAPFWLHIIFLIIPAWFGFIYREQEKELILKVENFIKSI